MSVNYYAPSSPASRVRQARASDAEGRRRVEETWKCGDFARDLEGYLASIERLSDNPDAVAGSIHGLFLRARLAEAIAGREESGSDHRGHLAGMREGISQLIAAMVAEESIISQRVRDQIVIIALDSVFAHASGSSNDVAP